VVRARERVPWDKAPCVRTKWDWSRLVLRAETLGGKCLGGCRWMDGWGRGKRSGSRSILWCCHIGDHPQGELATPGYSPAMKIKVLLKTSFNILATCFWTMCNNIEIFGDFKKKKISDF
jgi:hypothetical protein